MSLPAILTHLRTVSAVCRRRIDFSIVFDPDCIEKCICGIMRASDLIRSMIFPTSGTAGSIDDRRNRCIPGTSASIFLHKSEIKNARPSYTRAYDAISTPVRTISPNPASTAARTSDKISSYSKETARPRNSLVTQYVQS